MGIGIKIGNITTELGTPDFFHSFCSTISVCLEAEGWGTRFPALLNSLYRGNLSHAEAGIALNELDTAKKELAKFPPDKVVWDINNRALRPPWGDRISADIKNLSNYFVTSTGKDLITTVRECLEFQVAEGLDATIKETPPFLGQKGATVKFK